MFRSNAKFFLAFFAATMLFAVIQAYAVWNDAPAAPAQYGTIPGTTQNDYKPVNLGDTVQTKTGGLNIMGNVGIGTTSLGAKLDIGQGPAGQTAGLRIAAALNSSGPAIKVTANTRTFADNLVEIDDNAGNPNFVIRAGGNVGIGTTTPSSRFHINQSASGWNDGIRISNAGGPTVWKILSDAGSSWLTFAPDDDYSRSMVIRSDNGGRVGIGTTGPGEKLEVVGNISADGIYDRQDPAYYIDPNAAGNSAVLRGSVSVGGTLNAATLQEGGVAVQKLVNDNCGANQYIRAIADNGAVTCANDLTGSGSDGNNYPTGISFSGSGTKTLTLNRSGLTDLTASFTDNDTNTTYSAGTNLSLSGTTFNVVSSPTFSGGATFYYAGTQRVQISDGLYPNWISNGIGAASSPSYSFINDPNTGMYSLGADTIAFATNGIVRMDIGSSGEVFMMNGATINGTTNALGDFRTDFYHPTATVLFSAPTERNSGGANCYVWNEAKSFGVPGPGTYQVNFETRVGNLSDFVWAYLTCDGRICSDKLYTYAGINSTNYRSFSITNNTGFINGGEVLALNFLGAESSDGSNCSGNSSIYVRNVTLSGNRSGPIPAGVVTD